MSHKSTVVLEFSSELKRFVAELNAALAALFRPLGLTCVQADALMTLGELGPVSLKELAGCLVAESGHPSRLVSRLVDLGYVTRSASSDDGRAVILTLTEEGASLAAAAADVRAPLLTAIAEGYAARLAEATALLRELRAELEDDSPRGIGG
ncbi:MarR family winged helix-turn-helix transcriptional regulator [Cutibacterium sp. V947]|uniref:MarR family winged helix-turn-helix transcriptional regulator n=1 Tax=unclassified Cutibacterium TaxID=2649671 RepID=UPI003EE18235